MKLKVFEQIIKSVFAEMLKGFFISVSVPFETLKELVM